MKEYIVRVYEDRTEWRDSKTGELHRLGGPAFEHVDGSKEWRINGQLHREDGPAIETASGYKRWFIYGVEQQLK